MLWGQLKISSESAKLLGDGVTRLCKIGAEDASLSLPPRR